MEEIIFITSNKVKLAHAKYLCRKYAVRISKQKNYGIGYNEPRIGDRTELLQRSVADAKERFSKNTSNAEEKLFFIEDTSVIVRALSSDNKEVPGVDVKYWMQGLDFKKLNTQLSAVGGDRSVIVRSDLVLVLNERLSKKYGVAFKTFTSESQGSIVTKELAIKTQPLYPWLNNTTFNKWFVPDGAIKPLSSLPIDQADLYDFRRPAFEQMMEFLHQENLIKTISEYRKAGEQIRFFEPMLFVICGPSCAGKTTLASYLMQQYNYFHLEASDFMYLSFYETHGPKSSVSISDFAEKALKANPAIVSNQILMMLSTLKSTPVVITGFRDPKEIEILKEDYFGNLAIQTIYIEANINLRFKRSVKRGRQDSQREMQQFRSKDEQQMKMGLDKIKESNKNNIIKNESTFENFFREFEFRYKEQLKTAKNSEGETLTLPIKRKLESLIIKALDSEGIDSEKFFTTTEIAHMINKILPLGEKTRSKNNVSRYFNQNYHPFYELRIDLNGKIGYRLSQTGRAYAYWIKFNATKRNDL